ncbi:50S ribosomal protein L35ae [Candidatus Bathyarchaeota archaeon]|nr:50S ribosomal protein L35ae [Candidatus Bathyarchaeota archaeon]RJS80953.1 MAG: 50S ribosomal protein L35ae [Candidatus Bathyarchaeota archaeon]HDN63088.1 50S ribosomal protein L35ae [Candidatus Bathyarchaeota archaeon]
MSHELRGVILNYRLGIKNQRPRECLLYFPKVKNAGEAARLIGRKVVWRKNGVKIIGKIVSLHGRKGVVRARFRKGVPGQALGESVYIIG